MPIRPSDHGVIASQGGFAAIAATGGTTAEYPYSGATWKSHTFLSSANFIVSDAGGEGLVEVLIVAGGGGGCVPSGGAGAGGFRTLPSQPVTATTYPIVVGAGGAGSPYGGNPIPGRQGIKGNDSSGFSTTSEGGGGGGAGTVPGGNGMAGGSGGGGGFYFSDPAPESYTGGAGTGGQGNDGGDGGPAGTTSPAETRRVNGGGGGASQVGADAGVLTNGAGGDGTANTYRSGPGSPVTYAGGGGGGYRVASGAAGGAGGGGSGRGGGGAGG